MKIKCGYFSAYICKSIYISEQQFVMMTFNRALGPWARAVEWVHGLIDLSVSYVFTESRFVPITRS